jgi:hypothetical protein
MNAIWKLGFGTCTSTVCQILLRLYEFRLCERGRNIWWSICIISRLKARQSRHCFIEGREWGGIRILGKN